MGDLGVTAIIFPMFPAHSCTFPHRYIGSLDVQPLGHVAKCSFAEAASPDVLTAILAWDVAKRILTVVFAAMFHAVPLDMLKSAVKSALDSVHYRFGEIFLCHTSYYAHLRSPWSRHVTSAAAFFSKLDEHCRRWGWSLQVDKAWRKNIFPLWPWQKHIITPKAKLW